MLLRSTSRVRGVRPPGPVRINRTSPQARGLFAWWPLLGPSPLHECARSNTYPLAIVGDCPVRSSPDWGLVPELDGTGDYLSMNTSATDFHPSGSFALSIWVRGAMTTGADVGLFSRWAGSQGWMIWFFGNNLRLGDSNSSAVIYTGGQAVVQDSRWHHVVGRFPAAVASELYVDGVSRATGTGGGLGGDPATPLQLGQYANGAGTFPYAGQLADARFYARDLTPADIWQLYDPASRWDLYWSPSTRTHFFLNSAAGGTQYTQSVSGTTTTAGALLKETRRALTATATTAGALTKLTARALTGTLTTAGALAAIKIALKSIAGTLTTAGTLVRQTQKPLAATLTTAGALVKETRRALTGTLTTAGALSAIKTALKSLTGTLTTAGTLVRQVQLSKAGTLTTAGALTKLTARALTGTLTTAGTLSKLTARALSAVLSFLGTLVSVKQGAGTVPNIIRLTAVTFSAPSITSTVFSTPAISGVAWVDAD